MATPHVAGAAALVMSVNPALKGHPDQSRAVLRAATVTQGVTDPSNTGCGGLTMADWPNYQAGYGRIDAYARPCVAWRHDLHRWFDPRSLTGARRRGASAAMHARRRDLLARAVRSGRKPRAVRARRRRCVRALPDRARGRAARARHRVSAGAEAAAPQPRARRRRAACRSDPAVAQFRPTPACASSIRSSTTGWTSRAPRSRAARRPRPTCTRSVPTCSCRPIPTSVAQRARRRHRGGDDPAVEGAAARQSDQLRIAFDGDAVLFGDESERVSRAGRHRRVPSQRNRARAREPLSGGPFRGFLDCAAPPAGRVSRAKTRRSAPRWSPRARRPRTSA